MGRSPKRESSKRKKRLLRLEQTPGRLLQRVNMPFLVRKLIDISVRTILIWPEIVLSVRKLEMLLWENRIAAKKQSFCD